MKKNNFFFLGILILSSTFILTFFSHSLEFKDPGTLRKFPDPVFRNSALPRTSPIAITDNAHFTTYASSGDGSKNDPWIIEDFLIECNGTGIGIGIQDTTDYFIVRNGFVNESQDSGATFNLVLNNVVNGEIINVTCSESGATNVAIFQSYNNTISSCNFTDGGGTQDTYIDSSYNITIEDTIISNAITSISIDNFVYGVNCHDIILDNITCYSSTSKALAISEGHNFTVINSNFTDSNQCLKIEDIEDSNFTGNYIADNTFSGIELLNGTNITINYNTVNNSNRGLYLNSTLSTDITVIGNTLESNQWNLFGIMQDCTITNNTFQDVTNSHISLTGSSSDNVIKYNIFNDSSSHINSLGSNDVLENNYWLDYFEHYPNTLTVTLDSNVLDTVYEETGVVTDDLLPLYDPGLFPRSDEIEILVRRSIDWNQIIPDEWLYYHLDELTVLNTTRINAVLYRITIKDLFGHVGFDQQFNINRTSEPLIQVEFWKISIQNRLNIDSSFTVRSNGQKLEYTVENGSRTDIWVIGRNDYEIEVIDEHGVIWFDDTERINEHLRIVLSEATISPDVRPPMEIIMTPEVILIVIFAIGSSSLMTVYLARRNNIRSPGKRSRGKKRSLKPKRLN